MILERNVSIIIMLANIFEGEKRVNCVFKFELFFQKDNLN